jgi:hypothetical protein
MIDTVLLQQSNNPIICLALSAHEASMSSPTEITMKDRITFSDPTPADAGILAATLDHCVRRGAMRSRPDNRAALDAFMARKAEIDTMLVRLQELSNDHFGYAADDINWGHVGTLAHYAELLKRITDAAFKEGEHAT